VFEEMLGGGDRPVDLYRGQLLGSPRPPRIPTAVSERLAAVGGTPTTTQPSHTPPVLRAKLREAGRVVVAGGC
jgi:hypothetical protein